MWEIDGEIERWKRDMYGRPKTPAPMMRIESTGSGIEGEGEGVAMLWVQEVLEGGR